MLLSQTDIEAFVQKIAKNGDFTVHYVTFLPLAGNGQSLYYQIRELKVLRHFHSSESLAVSTAAEANQEFTHIATPEENAYIEAYHSILDTEIVQRFEFAGYYEAKLTLTAYVDFYNCRRLHGGINFKTPQQHWDEHQSNPFNPTGAKMQGGSARERFRARTRTNRSLK